MILTRIPVFYCECIHVFVVKFIFLGLNRNENICIQGAPFNPYVKTRVRLYSYRTATGALVYTRITLLRKEEVFCLKDGRRNDGRTEQRKGTGEKSHSRIARRCPYWNYYKSSPRLQAQDPHNQPRL